MNKVLVVIYLAILTITIAACQRNEVINTIKPILSSIDGQGEPG